MEPSIEEEFQVPSDATLEPQANCDGRLQLQAVLETSSDSPATIQTISLSAATRQRAAGRCLVVGRQAANADIRIQHKSISRKHAVLYFRNDSLFLIDSGGKYGTTVNNARITHQKPLLLKDGDVIVFGNVTESPFTVKITQRQEAQEQETTKSDDQDTSILQKAGAGLDGRAKREAEIAAMMESFNQEATYQKHIDTSAPTLPPPAERHVSTKQQALASKYKLPIQQLALPSESNRRHVATCIAVDPAGSRFVVGSTDRQLRFYDFGGMARNNTGSFLSVIPEEGHVVGSCAYSNTGDRIIVGTGSVQPIVLDREGQEIIKFMRGDMYVTDQAKTVGHTSAVTAVDWHPLERDIVVTASMDGSARLWNLQGKTQFDMLVCEKVFQAKNSKGQRTAVCCVCFHPSGREFALGTACGSIQIWNHARVSTRPERVVYDAHGEKAAVTCLVYNFDGSLLASRSVGDSTAKIWTASRISRSSAPLIVCKDLESLHEQANLAFSPDSKVICAGASAMVDKGSEVGRLCFYDISKNSPEATNVRLPIISLDLAKKASPVVIKWHNKLQQILVGCADGSVTIFYDRLQSKNGALLVSSKASQIDSLSEILHSRAEASGNLISGPVITPFSLPMYREDHTSEKKRKRQERKDPVKSKEPERPATGKHKTGGQEGSNVTFAQFVADGRVAKGKAIAGEDPREALLRFGKGNEERPDGDAERT